MTFLHPWVLLLAPLLLWLLRKPRGRTSVTVASTRLWPDGESGRARFLWLPPFLRRTALVLLVAALARPQAESTFDLDVSEGIAIQMLVDVSSSMHMPMTDFHGEESNRMEVAKQLVERFIAGDGDQLNGRPDDLIGLITFARYADTRSPLTFGHHALLQIVRQLTIQERPNEDGTAYGDALAIAAAHLKNPTELLHGRNNIDPDSLESRVIILLTDGENNSGAHMPLEAAGLAKQWGCRIYVISMGDPADTSPANPTGALSSADRVLEHIATQTGGVFRKANDSESLLSVYSEVDRLERTKIATRSFGRIAEWFWLPLSLALVCLVTALTLEATCLRVVP
ncbi:MAG: VWA domain-containing protein [Verrucomicrobiales bacterium]|nr:VWA domain-containing protein [Verrucomicrobiota bacterium JB025]